MARGLWLIGINNIEKVVPIEESLSKRSKVKFQQLANCGRPCRRTVRFSEDGRVDLLSLPRTGEWPVARLVIPSSLNMPINFYSVNREALTMPVNCKVDLSYNRNMTRSLSTVQQSVRGSFFLWMAFPGVLLEE